jgi:hypothetical protein
MKANPMPATAPTRRRRLPVVVTAVLALVLAACGGDDDPSSALADAFERTFSDSLAYELTIDADDAALTGMAEDDGQVAAIVRGLALEGVMDDDAMSLTVRGLGSPLLELRSLDEGDTLFARLGIRDLLALAGGGDFDPAQLLALSGTELSAETEAVVLAGLEGRWLAIEGGFEEAIDAGASEDTEEAEAAVEELLGGDLAGFLERYVTAAGEDRGDEQRTIEVEFQLREFLRAASEVDAEAAGVSTDDLEADLAELPETVPGLVTLQDGLVTELRIELATPLRDSGAEVDGDLDLVLDLYDHGAVDPVVAPEDPLAVTPEQLEEAFEALSGSGMGGGLGLPIP